MYKRLSPIVWVLLFFFCLCYAIKLSIIMDISLGFSSDCTKIYSNHLKKNIKNLAWLLIWQLTAVGAWFFYLQSLNEIYICFNEFQRLDRKHDYLLPPTPVSNHARSSVLFMFYNKSKLLLFKDHSVLILSDRFPHIISSKLKSDLESFNQWFTEINYLCMREKRSASHLA